MSAAERRGPSGDWKTYENSDKLASSRVKVCWRCKSNLWSENTVLCFSPWFAYPLKLNLRTNRKYKIKKPHNKQERYSARCCYYAVHEARGERQSICERSFVSAFFRTRIFFFYGNTFLLYAIGYNCWKYLSVFILLAQGMYVCEYINGFNTNYKVIAEGQWNTDHELLSHYNVNTKILKCSRL